MYGKAYDHLPYSIQVVCLTQTPWATSASRTNDLLCPTIEKLVKLLVKEPISANSFENQ
jgi:hypothetical protein